MDSNQAALAWEVLGISVPLAFFGFMNQNRLLWLQGENGPSKCGSPLTLLQSGV